MAQNSSCGRTKEEREDHLRSCGFAPIASGKGSHSIWSNARVKSLYEQGHKIEVPAYLVTVGQKPWEIALCDDPAGKTWHKIEKHATCCKDFLDNNDATIARAQAQKATRDQFRANMEEICAWRKNVKHCLRMGQEVPKAPACYTALQR